MQGRFASYPGGAAGTGLLLLRLLLAAGLLGTLSGPASTAHLVAIGVVALLLALGLWARAACLLAVGLEITRWITAGDGRTAEFLPLTALAGSLMLLGPGAWSLDAKLFGRRVISVPWRRPDK